MTSPEAVPAAGGSIGPAAGSDRLIGWSTAARAAAVAGLGRPRLWPLALVAFLLRGGLILYLLPIVVVPSTVGLATFIGPTAITPAGPSGDLVRLVAVAVVAAVAWLVVGGLVAAAAEGALIRQSMLADEPIADAAIGAERAASASEVTPAGAVARILLVRFVASTPLIVACAWGIPRLVGAAYRELTSPVETAAPLPLRVLSDVPEVLVAVFAGWLFAQTVGGLAVRRIVLFGERGPEATFMAVRHVVRHPVATAASTALLLGGSSLLVVPGLVAAAIVWERLGRALVGDVGILPVLPLTLLFVGVWICGLALAGAAAAWRSVAMTLEVLRTGPR